VLLKSDGFPTYHLANVVDDHLMEITDVIRAEEWISSTPKHVLLYKAFGWQVPRFWHMPLLRNIDKSKISKRKNPVSLIYYRDSGYLPEAIINFLGLMGGGMPPDFKSSPEAIPEKFTLAEMVEHFVFTNIRVGGPVFDLTKLKWLNGEYLRAITPEAFYTALRSTILSDSYLRGIAALIQTRVETLGQFGDLTGFFFRDDRGDLPGATEQLARRELREQYRQLVVRDRSLAQANHHGDRHQHQQRRVCGYSSHILQPLPDIQADDIQRHGDNQQRERHEQ